MDLSTLEWRQRRIEACARLAGFTVAVDGRADGGIGIRAARRVDRGLEGFAVVWPAGRNPEAVWRFAGWPREPVGAQRVMDTLTALVSPTT